ncbi:Ig-like domain-containing protein [Aquimarina sp. 2201CG14-23]|uniref:Ig-like domain-containing protein n=1 Tax=Aquimarina mycalae TaxID=3040073 RepID=UPI002477D912|nr:Ig-like domain-containing protein [Aquimarina sp. 2201CG14-23]MDH7444342.1 Ig-like domain-containing protein [Aquimarina sp. 2201CG14-23]
MMTTYSLRTTSFLIVLAISMLGVSCGKGKCAKPDVEKIKASISMAAGGLTISGAAGAVEPGATVTITDAAGVSTTVTANKDGSFFAPFGQSNAGLGDTLSITQKTNKCAESDPTKTVIQQP